jgi:hypothetical protein
LAACSLFNALINVIASHQRSFQQYTTYRLCSSQSDRNFLLHFNQPMKYSHSLSSVGKDGVFINRCMSSIGPIARNSICSVVYFYCIPEISSRTDFHVHCRKTTNAVGELRSAFQYVKLFSRERQKGLDVP